VPASPDPAAPAARRPATRVAFITTSYPAYPGDPAGHFVQSEALAEAARGNLVTVLAPGTEAGFDTGDNPRVLRLPDSGLFGWPGAMQRLRQRPQRLAGAIRFVTAARAALRNLGPFDRLVAHWIVPCGWPIAASYPAAVEVVAHGSDVRLLASLPHALTDSILFGLVRRGASFRFVSHRLRDRLCGGARGWLLSRSRVMPSPIRVAGVPTRAAAREKLGLSPLKPVVLIVSRLVESKRVQIALGAATLVPGARVVVVGDGPQRPSLAARFPGVQWEGQLPRPQALAWMAAADAVVTASRREGACSVVREAVALGTPVVTTPNGDLRPETDCEPLVWVVATLPGR
jgi:teichuronic acid biosynthesis glycosyltransferase TuaC